MYKGKWTYRIGRDLCGVELKLWHRMRVEGAEHIPPDGGVLIVANHQSFLDIPLIGNAVERHVTFVARETLADFRPMGAFLRGCEAILIKRGASDRAALGAIVEKLREGAAVGMFPEGTRSRDGSLGRFRSGVVVVARRAGTPILPAGIRGTYDAFNRNMLLPRPRRVAVRFGPLLDPTTPDVLDRAQEAIAAMIGEGHYDSVPSAP